ncbi:hypothetical protein ACH47C_13910 [Streptomyces rishiriensis]|uniref:hypothetical protein n=1 Tax=Streptomyces rishiriensis TaxID=68264 RepID=UPI0033DAF6A9
MSVQCRSTAVESWHSAESRHSVEPPHSEDLQRDVEPPHRAEQPHVELPGARRRRSAHPRTLGASEDA